MEFSTQIITSHCSSGHKSAIKEVLEDPQISSRIKNTKAFMEVKTMDAFYEMLNKDISRLSIKSNTKCRDRVETDKKILFINLIS